MSPRLGTPFLPAPIKVSTISAPWLHPARYLCKNPLSLSRRTSFSGNSSGLCISHHHSVTEHHCNAYHIHFNKTVQESCANVQSDKTCESYLCWCFPLTAGERERENIHGWERGASEADTQEREKIASDDVTVHSSLLSLHPECLSLWRWSFSLLWHLLLSLNSLAKRDDSY